LHSVFTKPYNTEADAEKKRTQKAVATAQLITDVLAQTSDDDEYIPAAKVRIGIDSGTALAVNNGRHGNREPLFLGNPANHAAKIAGKGKAQGIFLTNAARQVLGLAELDKPEYTPLTNTEITVCQEAAGLDVSVDSVVREWREDLKNNPLGNISFFSHTPPLSTMDIESLTPANSRRQDAISLYADISGFTAYVADHIDENTEDVVRVLHVVRAELERVLSTEFLGRRVRYIGDCVHGLFCEGTSSKTDEVESVSNATLLAGGLRSSFNAAIERLSEEGYATGVLGLAIGFEYGPMNVTRLGLKGDRIRCSVSRGVIASEAKQRSCYGDETAIGDCAYKVASEAVRKLFTKTQKAKSLDYAEAVDALADAGDETAKKARSLAFIGSPAIAKAQEQSVRPYASGTSN
jgi:class 3 adenylate cyclase